MKNLVLLISGRGSNMQAIVRACREQNWPARVAAVISDRPEAAGLALAQQAGVATAVVDRRQYPTREAFDAALAAAIDAHAPDAIALCGFMRVLGPDFVDRYAGRLLNIHPSLLPAFTGLHTHARAIEAGVKYHGATVHLVTAELDHGPILGQAVVPVADDDTPDTLAVRVLQVEHQLYPQVLRDWIEGRIEVQGLRSRRRLEAAR